MQTDRKVFAENIVKHARKFFAKSNIGIFRYNVHFYLPKYWHLLPYQHKMYLTDNFENECAELAEKVNDIYSSSENTRESFVKYTTCGVINNTEFQLIHILKNNICSIYIKLQ
jgi:hypothetical protein